jgi:two-component sensor histidine kinase
MVLRGIIALYLITSFAHGQVKPVIDSLRVNADTTQSQETRINLLQQIAYEWAEANFDSGFFYAKKMNQEALALGNLTLRAKAHIALGIVYDYHYKLDSARKYYISAKTLATQAQDTATMAMADFDLASIEYASGNYIQAIDKRTADLFQKTGNERYLAKVYNNIGQVYVRTENYDAAIKIYSESIAIKEKLNDTKGRLNTMTNLSSVYFEKGDYANSEKTSKALVELAKSVGDTMAYKNELLNLLRIYKKQEQPNLSLPTLNEANALARSTDPITMKGALYGAWAEYAIDSKNAALANQYLTKLEPIHTNTQVLKVLYFRLMAAYNRLIGNHAKAYDFLNQLMEENKRQLSEKVRNRTKEVEILFETEKKEKQILSLELEKQTALAETQRSQNQRNAFVFSTIALLLLAGSIFYFYRQRTRTNQLLEEKNTTISNALKERETLLREIHHRVKNNLQIISSLLNLQVQNVKDEAALSAVSESRNRVKSMAMIHEQLYRHHGVTGIFLPDYLKQLAESLRNSFGRDDETVPIHLNVQPFLVDVDTAVPMGLIITELLTNSFKYAFPENRTGNIFISLDKENSALVLHVDDDGVGIKGNRNGNSFGHSLVEMLVKKLNGEVFIKNENGTKAQITIREFTLVEKEKEPLQN